MNVGIVTQDDYPSVGEVRPRKLALCLHRAAHRVVFLGWNSRQRALTEDIGYATVYRFPWFLRSRFYSWLGSPSPLNPFWLAWILQVTRRDRLDILIVSNVRIALPAILAGRLLKKPVVLDLQENNPAVVRLRPKTSWIHYLTRNSTFVALLEKVCVALADHTWVVVEERVPGLPARARVNGRVSVVGNTPFLEEVQSDGAAQAREHQAFTLIYVGLSGGFGTIEQIVSALPHVLEQDKNVKFLIGGDRSAAALVQELGIQDHVALAGLIEPEKVSGWLRQGDLGIIAYSVNAFTDTTVSNKLFQYMAAGLPVLSTDMAPTRRILEEVGCGVVIPRGSGLREVAEIILRLKQSPELRTLMGQKGMRAVAERYNWSQDFAHALSTLQGLIVKTGRREE